ncbi:hypothetical protein BW42_03020 [Exiguobacterium sp. RIT341]|nr:hypothetical protein BW42_03020 [Exiguobacterium sp. RIT341]
MSVWVLALFGLAFSFGSFYVMLKVFESLKR